MWSSAQKIVRGGCHSMEINETFLIDRLAEYYGQYPEFYGYEKHLVILMSV